MRRRQGFYLAVLTAAATLALPLDAQAELLQSVRDSVMCASPDALAKLALPHGGSRTTVPIPPPQIEAIARAGGCVDFKTYHVVIVITRRTNTTIVRSDTLSGDGVMGTYIIANIDFAPYVPHDLFFDRVRARCPTKLDGLAAQELPTLGFIKSLQTPLRQQIEKSVEDECGGSYRCSFIQRDAEISRHGLDQRWVEYACNKP